MPACALANIQQTSNRVIMDSSIRLTAVVLLSLSAGAALAQTETSPSDTKELLKRLDEQEQRIKVLERKLEIQDAATKAATASTPVVKASPSRVSIQSADGANFVRLRGLMQFDGRYFSDLSTPATANTWLLRRVRPIIEGTLHNIYDFRFMPDFGQGKAIVQDAYVAARFRPWAILTGGKFKVPVGLERLESAADIRFIERGFPTSLVPNRDLGLQLSGELGGGAFSYSFGYFNGVTDGGSSDSYSSPDVKNAANGDLA